MSTSSTRWERIEAVFDEAADLPHEQRTAFLDRACRHPDGTPDPDLRAEVESLLALDVGAEGFFGEAQARLADVVGRAAGAQVPVPERVGPWRIVEEVGQGGMGMVYRAERDDGAFEQTVALKLVRPGLAPDLAGRFLAERQILAELDHPNVARLVGGGVADDERPWLAMEYVAGEPITDYCDHHRLSVNERLDLFTTVCEAVAAAHRSLVVHRDLKPSNIFVTPDRQVKLLDFGIAKLLGGGGAAEPRTRTGRWVLTPEYAAPEQVTGGPITTATDVYALGAILYELLTGRRAVHVEGRSPAAIERAVLQSEPPRPSDAVTASAPTGGRVPPAPDTDDSADQRGGTGALRSTTDERLRRRLRGDLDRIVLKALRKEPERRYESAPALAADVRRHLDGLPVEARPDTAGYRIGKFVRRHRGGVVAAVLVLLAILGGAGVALWQAAEAHTAQARAETEAATAEEVADFLVGLFGASDPAESRGDSVLVREVLERGTARLDEDLADQPAVHARLQAVLGRVYYELGRLDRADSLLRAALASSDLADPDEATDARLVLSSIQAGKGDFDAAIASAQTAFEEARARYPGDDPLVAAALTQLGYAHVSQGFFEEAEPLLTEAAAMQARLHPEPHLDHAEALDNLGILYYQQRDYARAADLLRQALALQRELHAGRPHPDLAISLDNIGAVLMARDSMEQALPYFEESVAMQARLHPEPHPDRAISLNNYGVLLLQTGRLEAAEQTLQEALDMKRSLFGPDHPSAGITTGWLGKVARERGDMTLAEERYRRAYAIASASYEPGHGTRTGAAHALAGLLATTGREAEAERLYLATYRDALDAHGPAHALTQQALEPLPGFYEAWGRPDEAARWRARGDSL